MVVCLYILPVRIRVGGTRPYLGNVEWVNKNILPNESTSVAFAASHVPLRHDDFTKIACFCLLIVLSSVLAQRHKRIFKRDTDVLSTSTRGNCLFNIRKARRWVAPLNTHRWKVGYESVLTLGSQVPSIYSATCGIHEKLKRNVWTIIWMVTS